ncbi:MAG: heparinase II/III family protein, partial [Desulfobacterales bacterium]
MHCLILCIALISALCCCAVPLCASETEENLRLTIGKYPDRIAALFENLDLDRPELHLVKKAAERQDRMTACRELLRHFQQSPARERFRNPQTEKHAIGEAEKIQKDIFTFLNRESRVPRLKNRGLNWNWQGPDNDPEWAWHFNRHTHLHILLDAWEQTGNPVYVQTIDAQIQDWILSHPPPNQESFSPQWRGIEVFHRLCWWPRVFFRLSDELSPQTRLLMLSSIPDHSRYLMRFPSESGNRLAMELNGLAIAAECWPEFREAPEWGQYAADRIFSEIKQQVYPDGVHKELSAHYHKTALDSFMNFFYIRTRAGKQMPAEYMRRLERMWQYLACVMRPDGFGPHNNDSFRTDFREPV